MHYVTFDGQNLEAETDHGLVEQLRKHSPNPEKSTEDFMRQTAKRVGQWNAARIRHGTPSEFVADLVEQGFIMPNRER